MCMRCWQAGAEGGMIQVSTEEAAGGSRGTLTYGEVSGLRRLQDSFKGTVLLQTGKFKTKVQECAKNTVYSSCRSRCRAGL